jgi:FtsP/CotA-like multicopper oxidase with cupredoxin domain
VPLGVLWQRSLLPDSYDMAQMGYLDYGGGPANHGEHADDGDHGVLLTELVDDPDRPADVSHTLTVAQEGRRFTVNGTSPGPTITATVGDMVEVRLVNDDVTEGATLHWHGVETPNAMDGVAGVTQDAVLPGETFTYRFIADHVGTFWYHSHQISHEQVLGGLFGALVVLPETPDQDVRDEVAVLHQFSGAATLNGEEGTSTLAVGPGQRLRLRVVNTDNAVAPVWVAGADYEVLSVDGYDINGPEPVEGLRYDVPAGGRVDLGITVPVGGARVEFAGTTALVLGQDPGSSPAVPPDAAVDQLTYGTPTETGIDTAEADRRFDYRIGKRPGFLDGRPGLWWTVNGHLFPNVPMYTVDEGDLVVFRIENGTGDAHPMHLHGHHALVLTRDGEPASGAPWWVDSLEVGANEKYEIAFVADNPGLWMDHCHNLPHAAEGLVAHLMYSHVISEFRVGGERGNEPE